MGWRDSLNAATYLAFLCFFSHINFHIIPRLASFGCSSSSFSLKQRWHHDNPDKLLGGCVALKWSRISWLVPTSFEYCKWPNKFPLPNKCLLSTKRPLCAVKIVLDAPLLVSRKCPLSELLQCTRNNRKKKQHHSIHSGYVYFIWFNVKF